jgi:predicted nucleic acid-binding protein
MAANVSRNILVDAGSWYALFDPRDSHSSEANAKAHYIDNYTIIVPWPTLYETLGTRFVKKELWMGRFEHLLTRGNVQFVDDIPYRNDALKVTFREGRLGKRAISLCDMLIRLLIQDTNVRIDALLTFNIKDFADVCRQQKVEVL